MLGREYLLGRALQVAVAVCEFNVAAGINGVFVGAIVSMGVGTRVGVGVIVTNANVCGDRVGKVTAVGVIVGVGEPFG